MTPWDRIARTAKWTATVQGMESMRNDRLYNDPLAALLAGDEGFDMKVRADAARRIRASVPMRENPFLPIRPRFFDDYLLETVAAMHIRQVVIAPGGLDTRAFRLDLSPDVVLFELDRRELLDIKRRECSASV